MRLAEMQESDRPVGSCKNCTLLLMEKCYGRNWWFRLVREPLLLGMRLLARWHKIGAYDYLVANPDCNGCIRFMKKGLQEKSPLFRWLDGLIGPHFKGLSETMLTEEDKAEAKQRARERLGG